MNSGIQCLSNSEDLTRFFLDDSYTKVINRMNPLGMKGQLVESFAKLIQEMWSGNNYTASPYDFRSKIGTQQHILNHFVGQYSPLFASDSQQDAQELLSFLLDGIHEEMNRVTKKTYVELRESDGGPDEIVAKEAWQNHLKRNDSIIVDLFHGQYKSNVVCPTCHRISVTFDPFLFLSLPIPPAIQKANVKLTFVDKEGHPKKYAQNAWRTIDELISVGLSSQRYTFRLYIWIIC